MAKLIVVFGATGDQGGAVARSLAADPTFKVRGLTSCANHPQAAELQQLGVEMVQASVNDKQGLVSALTGAYGCFIVTETDFSNPDPMKCEMDEGRTIAEACAHARVQHVVYSTAWPVHIALGIPARNCDAKAEIEQIMRGMNLPLSFITVPVTYESLLTTYKPQQCPQTGAFLIALPIGDSTIDFMSVEDIGPVVKHMFSDTRHFLNKTCAMSAEKMTVKDIAQILRRQLQPHTFRDRKVTVDEFRKYVSVDLANMFDCYARNEQRSSIDTTLRLNDQLTKFETWVTKNGERILAAINAK